LHTDLSLGQGLGLQGFLKQVTMLTRQGSGQAAVKKKKIKVTNFKKETDYSTRTLTGRISVLDEVM